jgi:hypothetical protein
MDEPLWVSLLREQRATNFADIAGAHASVTLPIDDRLLTRLIASRLPPSLPIKDLDLHAVAGNEIVVRLRLSRVSFLPPLTIRVAIERQPILPASPVLVLRIVSEKLSALAGTALRFLEALPEGLRLEQNLLHVDLAVLLARYGAGQLLPYLTAVELTTAEGRIIVAASLAVRDTETR